MTRPLSSKDDGAQSPVPQSICAQCGREGTRGFRVLTAQPDEGPYTPPAPITVCANTNACRKRWPRVSRDDD